MSMVVSASISGLGAVIENIQERLILLAALSLSLSLSLVTITKYITQPKSYPNLSP